MAKFFLIIFTLFGSVGIIGAQTARVSGTVVSDNGAALYGASVVLKGDPTTGTMTDADGNFSLIVPEGSTKLLVSFVGMVTQEVDIDDAPITIHLVSGLELDEIVVGALGIPHEKRKLGYVLQEIDGSKLNITPQTDLNNALAGKVAGVRLWSASGATFDEGEVILRGTTSLNPKGTAPIYVIDGVIADVNIVDINNVASVNVLKGPNATALYGSRGGNGAIVITTRQPERGKSRVEIRQSLVVEQAVPTKNNQTEYGGGSKMSVFRYDPNIYPSYLSKLDGVRYYDYATDMSWGARFDGQPYAPWYAWDPTHPKFGQTAPYVSQPADNLKDLYKTGLTSNTFASFSKQTDNLGVNISASNQWRTGVTENSHAVRRFLTVGLDFYPTDRLNVALDYKYTYRKNHNAATEEPHAARIFMYSYTQWFHRDVNINDLKDYRRNDGTFRTWNPADALNGNFEPMYHNNPFALMNEINDVDERQWTVLNGTVAYDIIKGVLRVGLKGDALLNNYFGDSKVPYHIHGVTPSYSVAQERMFDVEGKAYASFYKHFFDNRFEFEANLFLLQRERNYRSTSGSTTDGLTADRFFNLAASVGKPEASNEERRLKEQSIFGYTTLGWNGTYYLEAALRNDWLSTFPSDNNSFLYGSLNGAVVASNYLSGAAWLNFWKLRASIARVGSIIEPYMTKQTYEIQDRYGDKTAIMGNKTYITPDIRPTISTAWCTGTEIHILNNRVTADLTYYVQDAKDQIIDLTVAPVSGYTTIKTNTGRIRNSGVEVILKVVPIVSKTFFWDVYINWAKNNNKLMELDLSDANITQYQLDGMRYYNYLYSYAEVGKPVGVLRGSSYVYLPDGQMVVREMDDKSAGDYIPLTDAAANAELGNIQPDATGGFGTSLVYGNLRLEMAFDYQIGGNIGSATNMFGEGSGMLNTTVGVNDKGHYIRDAVADGGGVKVQGVVQNGAEYTPVSGYLDAYYWYSIKSQVWEPYIYDASYLKMREIALTYYIPDRAIKSLFKGMTKASVVLSVQNPWLIYSGAPNIDASAIAQAYGNFLETGQLYGTRSWGLTLNVSF